MSELETLARMAAGSEFSLLNRSDLEAVGLERNRIAALVRSGELTRVARGLYVVGQASWLQTVGASVRSLRCPNAVSHRSAARLHGWWRSDDLDITVRVPADARSAIATIHRSTDLGDCDVEFIGGLCVTNRARTLVDLGLVLPSSEVCRLVEHAIALEVVGVHELLALRERVGEHGRNGVGAIDRALESMPEFAHLAESGPEVRLMRLLGRADLPPVPQYEVCVAGHRYRLDLAYPGHLVAIEYDGEAWHSTPSQLAADRRRQANLERAGWRVLRFRRADLFRPDNGHILRQVRAALEARP